MAWRPRGDAGLVGPLELPEDEIRLRLGHLSADRLAVLDRSYSHPAAPVTLPRVTSAFSRPAEGD